MYEQFNTSPIHSAISHTSFKILHKLDEINSHFYAFSGNTYRAPLWILQEILTKIPPEDPTWGYAKRFPQ